MTCPEEEKLLCGSDGITYRYFYTEDEFMNVRTISLTFLSIILRVLRLEASVWIS
jgi:hypothetical protein